MERRAIALQTKLRLRYLAAFAVSLSLCPTAWAGEVLPLGNCEKTVVLYENGNRNGLSGFMTHEVRYRMRAYTGCELAALVVSFDPTSMDCKGRAFVTSDAAGTNVLAEQEFKVEGLAQWDTIRFEKPYVVSGSEIYFGYELQGAECLMAAKRFTTGDDRGRLGGNGWQPYDARNVAPAMLALLTGATLPQADVTLSHLQSSNYVTPGEQAPCSTTLCNLGTQPIGSISVTYHVGSETQHETVEGLSIAPRQAATVKLSGPRIDAEGDYNVWMEVSAVNGQADATPYDNSSNSWQLCCRQQLTERRVLMEIFSTELCTQCPQAHKNIDRLFGQDDRIIEVGHHAGFYTDPLTLDESVRYEWFYTPNRGTYAPAAMMDRSCLSADLPNVFTDDVPMFDASKASTLQPTYAMTSSLPAQASVEIETTYDTASRTLKATLSGQRLLPTEGDTRLGLNVWVVEDSVFSQTQAAAYGNYYHRHVLRHCLTSVWGDAIDLDKGYCKEYSLRVPEAWDERMLHVVAFVSNYDAENRNNCRVLNANKVRLTPQTGGEGIDSVSADRDTTGRPAHNLYGQQLKATGRGLSIRDRQIIYIKE